MRLKGETILRETHLAKDIEHELEILRTNTVDAARRAVGLSEASKATNSKMQNLVS